MQANKTPIICVALAALAVITVGANALTKPPTPPPATQAATLTVPSEIVQTRLAD